jgi:hypothetical protein
VKREDFMRAVRDAAMSGPMGERKLLKLIPLLAGDRKTDAVAALGDAQGPDGAAALRELLGRRDIPNELRSVALLALAKREGSSASDVLAAHLGHRYFGVQDMAIRGLAVVGDDRAWPEALKLLREMLDRPVPHPDQGGRTMESLSAMFVVMVYVTYLIRTLQDSRIRLCELVDTLRANFDRLYTIERAFLLEQWAEVEPGGESAETMPFPDPEPFRQWAMRPMFHAAG